MDRSLGLAVLAALVAALVAAAPLAAAAAAVTVSISVYTEKVKFYVPVVDENVSIPANTTKTFNITLPPKWKQDDVEAVIVIVKTDEKLSLAARDANGTVLATADVVPLSTGYTTTLPPGTAVIELGAPPDAAANATIQVYLQSGDAEFKLTPETTSVTLTANQAEYVEFSVEQVSGPSVFVYFNSIYPSDIQGFTASMLHSDRSSSYEGASGGVWTSGAGWQDNAYLRLYWDGTKYSSNTVTVRVVLYADPDGPDGPTQPMAVAQVNLSMPTASAVSDVTAHLGTRVNAKLVGLGLLVLLLLLLAAGGGRRGRRGMATPGGVLLILLLIAALAIAAGLIDINVHPSIDAKMLGLGVIALLLFLMLAKPQMMRRAARRLGL